MKEFKISAIREGTVIDHIPTDMTFKVVGILNLAEIDNIVSIGTNLDSKRKGKKGLIKVGGKFLTKEEVNKISLIAPDATLNIIKDYEVVEKTKVNIPDLLDNIIKCSNPRCITNNDDIKTKFYTTSKDPLKIRCHYCERIMSKEDIDLL